MKIESERLVAVADHHTADAQASTIATLQTELERHRAATAAQTAQATATAQAHTAEQRVAQLTSELAQARSELTIQAKIVGEVEALRKQVTDLQWMFERMGKHGTKSRSTYLGGATFEFISVFL